MEQKVSKNLDELPGSESRFWDGEVHTDLKPHKETSEDGHFFEYTSAVSAQCKLCNWGFQLEPGDKIKNGHLYDKKGKLVI